MDPGEAGSGERSVDRLVQFSDGVFTVALTLLVIDIAVPNLPAGATESALVNELASQVPNILAFLLTFWVVAAFWLNHHRFFTFIRRYDGRLILLNLVFLMTVCFIPWPTAVLGHYGSYLTTWVLYALSMAAIGIAALAIWVYASNKPSLVDDVTPELRRYYATRAAIQPVFFLISVPIAAVSLTAGQLAWAGMYIALWLVNRRFRRTVDARYRPIA